MKGFVQYLNLVQLTGVEEVSEVIQILSLLGVGILPKIDSYF